MFGKAIRVTAVWTSHQLPFAHIKQCIAVMCGMSICHASDCHLGNDTVTFLVCHKLLEKKGSRLPRQLHNFSSPFVLSDATSIEVRVAAANAGARYFLLPHKPSRVGFLHLPCHVLQKLARPNLVPQADRASCVVTPPSSQGICLHLVCTCLLLAPGAEGRGPRTPSCKSGKPCSPDFSKSCP